MINKKELRIGSSVKDRGGKIFTIDYWESPTKVAAKAPVLDYDPVFGTIYGHPITEEVDYLQPIDLTKEIILNCGFEIEAKGMAFEYYQITIYKNCDIKLLINLHDDCAYVETIDSCKSLPLCESPIYLHQLQNLYFQLTGKELKLELK